MCYPILVNNIIHRKGMKNMARGRKNYTLEERLEQLTKDISDMENSLSSMKEQKKLIEKEIKAKQLDELNTMIEASGLTFDEVKEILKPKNE